MTTRALALPAAIVSLVLLLFAPFLFQGKYFVPQDFLRCIYPWKTTLPVHNLEVFDVPVQFYPFDLYTREEFSKGRFPLWNPNVFSGHPMHANGWSGPFYPPRLVLLWLFSAATARTLNQFLHLIGAGLAMYALLKGRGLRPLASTVGAVSWMLNAYTIGWLEFCHVSSIACWVPCMMLGIESGLRRGWRGWMVVALTGGLMLHAGHIQFCLYVGPAIGLYALLRIRQERTTWALPRFALGAVLAVMLSAPLTIPFMELQRQCQRPPMDLEGQSASLLSYLPTLVCPDFWGNPARGALLNRCPANLVVPEFYCYFGLFPLLLAMLALVWGRTAEIRFWGTLAVGSLWAASATFPYSQIAHAVGFLATLVPSRILIVFVLAGSQLAAHGTQLLLEEWPKQSRRLMALAVTLGTLWTAVLLAVGTQADELARWALPSVKIPPSDTPNLAAMLPDLIRDNFLGNPQAYVPLVAALLCLAATRSSPGRAVLAMLVFTGLELVWFASVYSPTVTQADLLPRSASVQYLQRQPGLFRVDKIKAGFYCTLMPYGMQLTTGYESLYPLRYYQLLSLVNPGRPLPMRSASLSSFDHPILDALNLKYLLVWPLEQVSGPRWQQRLAADCRIYENTRAMARAYIVGKVVPCQSFEQALAFLGGPEFRPAEVACLEGPAGNVDPRSSGTPVKVVSYAGNRVILEADPVAPGLLVLADQFYAGWECRVDGQRQPIYAANGVMRGVYLGAGRHQVEFVYRPASLSYGLWMAALALVVMAGLTLLPLPRRPPQ